MSSMLTGADRTKLVKVLSLLASSHDGERAAAGFMAAKMLRDRGLDWDSLIALPERTARSRPPGGSPPRAPTYPASAWIAQIQFLQRHAGRLTKWELDFVRSMATRTRLTTKQGEILFEVQQRLLGEGVR